MIRYGLWALEFWGIVSILLIILATVRLVTDPDPPKELQMSKHELFWTRVFSAIFWWLLLFSPAGRRALNYLIEGEEEENG